MKNSLPKTLPLFIWFFLKQYKLLTSITVGLTCLCSVDFIIRSYILKVIIDKITTAQPFEDIGNLLSIPIICYIATLIVINIAMRLRDYIFLKIFPATKSDIVTQVTKYLEYHSYEYFQNNFTGSLVNKIFDLDNGSEQIIKIIINGFLIHIVTLVIGLVTITYTNPLFAKVIFVWSIIFLVINTFATKSSKDLSKVFAEARSITVGKVIDSVTNIANIRFFVRNDHEISVINTQLKDLMTKDQNAQKFRLYVYLFQGMSVIILICVLFYLLIYLKQLDLITVGDFALIMTLSFAIADSVNALSSDYVYLSTYIGTSNQALSIITQAHSVMDKPNAYQLKLKEGKVEFKDITFKYNKSNIIFSNLSVTIHGKQKVGLVGYSGSGKSTFVNLMSRLFDIQSGQILVDDQDISEITQNSLRENIGFIPQDSVLFHRTLMENIRYGKLCATDLEVVAAAKKAHAHEFIMNIAEGYDSLVGERGIKLSGGQKQRIAIARAIIKNAPILVLDEATSSLDSINERFIQESLKELMDNKTVLVIAHRLSTLLSMDRILVFDKGRIVEDGTHGELLDKGGTYSALWNAQTVFIS